MVDEKSYPDGPPQANFFSKLDHKSAHFSLFFHKISHFHCFFVKLTLNWAKPPHVGGHEGSGGHLGGIGGRPPTWWGGLGTMLRS